MIIDRPINFLLTLLFGKALDGDRRVWFHSQNLNEDKHGEARWPPYHGRWWLHFGNRHEMHFSWNFWTHFCGASFTFDPTEDGWQFHVAFPPFSFWFSTNFFSKGMKTFLASTRMDLFNQRYGGHVGSSRYTGFHFIDIRIFNWTLWWNFFKFDWGWSNKMPKWMDGKFSFGDILFGKHTYKKVDLETRDIVIPMPEGNYPAKATLSIETRGPSRWFKKVEKVISVDIPQGIPHQGKGENSWDCGEDGIFGYGYGGASFREAADHGTQIVLERRKKYDGNRMAKYPDPSTRPMPPPAPMPDNSNTSSLN